MTEGTPELRPFDDEALLDMYDHAHDRERGKRARDTRLFGRTPFVGTACHGAEGRDWASRRRAPSSPPSNYWSQN
jgi:hypothetical protein